MTDRTAMTRSVDAVVVGAGFAGLYALHRLREAGLTVQLFEAGSGVGGTWYWNRYPGARCDVESADYSYSFSPELDQEWTWSERFSPQAEIEAYLNYVTDRFGLRKDIQFDTRVEAVYFNEAEGTWAVRTDAGNEVTARYCVMATGMLSAFNRPQVPGAESFQGEQYDTGRWPAQAVPLAGRRVAVIGTGSSGIQLITDIAPYVSALTVFQRTPSFSLPGANRTLSAHDIAEMKRTYPQRRLEVMETPTGNRVDPNPRKALEDDDAARQREFESRWGSGAFSLLFAYTDLMTDDQANGEMTKFLQSKILERVHDPDVATELLPVTYPAGAKRMCVDSGYYEVFNLPHVRLVNVSKTPIRAITATGVRTSEADFDADVIVYATGFDAMTGALSRIDIRGKGGMSLAGKWRDGPSAYLGLLSSGFPNLFLLTGPGSPSVLSNVVHSAEQHVRWMGGCIEFMRAEGHDLIEADASAEETWMDHVAEAAGVTLYTRAQSWYLGANIEGKPRRFMPYVNGTKYYREICDDVAANGYKGFRLSSITSSPSRSEV